MIKFPEDIERKIADGRISYGTGLVLKLLEKKERSALSDFLETLKPSVNKMREIAENLYEISKRENLTVAELIESREIRNIMSLGISRKRKIELLRNFLREKRFPEFSKKTSRIRSKIKALKLPPKIKISYPENFEKEKLTATIEFSNSEELEELLLSLRRKKKEFDDIIELL